MLLYFKTYLHTSYSFFGTQFWQLIIGTIAHKTSNCHTREKILQNKRWEPAYILCCQCYYHYFCFYITHLLAHHMHLLQHSACYWFIFVVSNTDRRCMHCTGICWEWWYVVTSSMSDLCNSNIFQLKKTVVASFVLEVKLVVTEYRWNYCPMNYNDLYVI